MPKIQRPFSTLFIVCLLLTTTAVAASATTNYYGTSRYKNGVSGLKGSRETIRYDSVSTSSSAGHGSCVIFGNALYASNIQIENGIYSCSGSSVDAGCTGGPNRFVEYHPNASTYTCYIYGAATLAGTNYPVRIERVAGQGPTYTYQSYFGTSAFGSVAGFPTAVNAGSWLEAFTTGTGTCSDWAANVTFANWSYLNSSSTWSYVTTSTSSTTCAVLGALNSVGTWTAYHA